MTKFISNFTTEESMIICRWIGELKGPQEVADLVKEELGKETTRQNIYLTYVKNEKYREAIIKYRNEYLDRVSDTPIANKKIRIERLEDLYRSAKTDAVRLKALSLAREEIEGNKNYLELYQKDLRYDPFKDVSNEELVRELREIDEKLMAMRKAELELEDQSKDSTSTPK